MSDFRVASRYAKSLLSLAIEQGKLEEVNKDMKLLTAVSDDNRAFYLMLKNPIIKHAKKKEILNNVFKGKVDDMTIAIFDILTRKNREAVLPAIAKEFILQYNLTKGIKKASVTTTFKLDKQLSGEFESIVKQISGKGEVELEEIVDADILGGFVLKVDDRQIDDSLRSKLLALKKNMTKNLYIKQL